MSRSKKRIRAHANPLAVLDIIPPASPDDFDWDAAYPGWNAGKPTEVLSGAAAGAGKKVVTMADIGCGFGGLLHTLSPLFPNDLIVGIEIRAGAVDIVERSIQKARKQALETHPADSTTPAPFHNISVIRSNIMKFAGNHFAKGQLQKAFFLFPDPHFKRSKYRLRVINPSYLDYYAYILAEGGILYTITDVRDLHDWMRTHLDQHPLFERIPDEELDGVDPCFAAIHGGTHEGQKVSRNHGDKWPACYRRISAAEARARGAEGKARVGILDDAE